ncbi:hypothetical protein CSQ88_11105 [Iodobacter sp. BJB302]|nr:hypothetical protein CSQ88_11105 [Iodobacter sp. BJB302]
MHFQTPLFAAQQDIDTLKWQKNHDLGYIKTLRPFGMLYTAQPEVSYIRMLHPIRQIFAPCNYKASFVTG